MQRDAEPTGVTRVKLDKFEDSFVDQPQDGSADALDNASATKIDQSRRRFSGAALAGGAVLLSLGNRSAWGGGSSSVAGCMSIMTLNSFHPETGMFTSAAAGADRPEHNIDLAKRIHEIGGAPEFLGRDRGSRWRTCEDPDDSSRICLVRGNCPQ